MPEEWVTFADAARRLGVSKSTISRVVRKHHISTKPDTIDTRILLVDYPQLHRVMSSSVKYRDRDQPEE